MSEECNHLLPNGATHCYLCNKQIYGGKNCQHLWVYKGGYSKCIACGKLKGVGE